MRNLLLLAIGPLIHLMPSTWKSRVIFKTVGWLYCHSCWGTWTHCSGSHALSDQMCLLKVGVNTTRAGQERAERTMDIMQQGVGGKDCRCYRNRWWWHLPEVSLLDTVHRVGENGVAWNEASLRVCSMHYEFCVGDSIGWQLSQADGTGWVGKGTTVCFLLEMLKNKITSIIFSKKFFSQFFF